MRTRPAVLLVLPIAIIALIGAIQKPSEGQLKTEWSAFLKEYDAAYKAWLKPYTDAKTDDERNKVKLDFENMPSKKFLPRAAEFARKAKGTEYAASAWIWVFGNANQTPVPGLQKEALKTLLSQHIQSPKMLGVAQSLAYGSAEVTPEDAKGALDQIFRKSPDKETRAQALASLANMNMPYSGRTPEMSKAAEGYLKRLMAEYPQSKAAQRSKGALFELNNLQIGMTAPDFEATDENGQSFKLSDYRGKVVVLDFWGFW